MSNTETDTPQVKMSYREAAMDYGIGFAAAFFMAATVCGYLIMWEQHVSETLYSTGVLAFVLFSFAGGVLIAVAYLWPIRFYELLEGEYDG